MAGEGYHAHRLPREHQRRLVKAAQRAAEMGCECMQIFPRNPRGWKSRDYPPAEVAAFREARAQFNLTPLVLHSNYLVNLAASNPTLLAKSRRWWPMTFGAWACSERPSW